MGEQCEVRHLQKVVTGYDITIIQLNHIWQFTCVFGSGFYFSASERSALEQLEGGPCAVIAPVQAFIIKNLLLEYEGFAFREIVSIQRKTLN